MMHLADELFADSRLQCAADSASRGLGPMLHRQEIASPTQENIPSPDRIQFIPQNDLPEKSLIAFDEDGGQIG